MSGIFGFVRRDGGSVAQDLACIPEQLAALWRMGPDGQTTVADQLAVLGHLLPRLATVNVLSDGDGRVISFDGRIDNRAELSALTGAQHGVHDAALVLAAFEKWGGECASHLLGDFAFAIWDARSRTLFCARDPFGVRPFYYHLDRQRLFFSSDLKAILSADAALAQKISKIWLAEFLAGFPPAHQSTLYDDIKRLPPGYSCTVTQTRFDVRRYYNLKLTEEIRRPDAAEQFAFLLEEAVTCRMSDDSQVAAMLSGGLDSSSIAAIAAAHEVNRRGMPLHTYSMVYPATPTLDERGYIDEVVQQHRVIPHYLDCNDVGPIDDLRTLLEVQSGPLNAPNQAAMFKLIQRARLDGHQILLDGHGGDEVVSDGDTRLCDLAFNGHWIALWSELERIGIRRGRTDTLGLFLKLIRHYGPHRRLRPLAAIGRKLLKRVPDPAPGFKYVNAALARETGLRERIANLVPRLPLGQEERYKHLANIQAPVQSYAFEGLYRMGAAAGVELRFPFWDRRLVEFCLTLPPDEKLRDGLTRSILRRALGSRLPDRVRERTDKLDFMPHLVRGMLKDGGAAMKQLLDDPSGQLATFANLDVVRRAFEGFRDQPSKSSGHEVLALWRVAALATWLRTSAQ